MSGRPPDAERRARQRLAGHGVLVLYEDNHLLGLMKPAGLLSQGGPEGEPHLVSLIEAYRREAQGKPGRAYVGLVHRLDRNVSGALVVAKTSKAASRLTHAFKTRDGRLTKTYLAWVQGVPSPSEAELVDRVRRERGVTMRVSAADTSAPEARLRYAVAGRSTTAARLDIELGTGRTHQIRAQLAWSGHPLWGDAKYGGPKGTRPALHAHRLSFPHPVGGETVVVQAPLPRDLLDLDVRLGIEPPWAEPTDA